MPNIQCTVELGIIRGSCWNYTLRSDNIVKIAYVLGKLTHDVKVILPTVGTHRKNCSISNVSIVSSVFSRKEWLKNVARLVHKHDTTGLSVWSELRNEFNIHQHMYLINISNYRRYTKQHNFLSCLIIILLRSINHTICIVFQTIISLFFDLPVLFSVKTNVPIPPRYSHRGLKFFRAVWIPHLTQSCPRAHCTYHWLLELGRKKDVFHRLW